MSITVFIAEDYAIVREGLRSLVEKMPGVQVVGEAADGPSAVQSIIHLCPDIVIMDISMPGLNGIQSTRAILAKHPNIRVIALSVHTDLEYVVEMISAGAWGYISKESASDELRMAIQTALQDDLYISRHLNTTIIRGFVKGQTFQPAIIPDVLTERELDVLRFIADGYMNKEIATRMQISIRSVEAIRAQLYEKLGVDSVAELTKYAIRIGLSSL